MDIIARYTRKLHSRVIPIIKLQWHHSLVEEASRELEAEMWEQYTILFEPSGVPLSLLSWSKFLLVGNVIMTLRVIFVFL